MDLTLETPVFAGGAAFAAISRTEVTRHRAGCFASKRAVALLIRREDDILVLTPSGRPMSTEDVEKLCPGSLAKFAGLTSGVAA